MPTGRCTRSWPGSRSTRSSVISPDIGGGFGNKVGIYPGYVLTVVGLDRHRQAGEVDGGPLGEPDVDQLRPRLPHARRDRRHA